MSNIKQRFISLREKRLLALTAVLFGLCIYALTMEYPDHYSGYIASFPALLIIGITALARVNDIGKEQKGWVWHVRRLGLVFAGASAVTILASPLSTTPRYPSWTGVMMFWGVALTWITTPNMPPWSKYITGEAKAIQYFRRKMDCKRSTKNNDSLR